MWNKLFVNLRKKYFFTFFFFALALTLFLLTCYYRNSTNQHLSFSDGAKFADIARNIVNGKGYTSSFHFFGRGLASKISENQYFKASNIPPAMPRAMALSFSLFGISDFSVFLVGGFFFFLLVIFVFLLAKELYGELVGYLSAVAIAVNPNFLDYASSGASEVLFALLAVMSAFFIVKQEKWSDVLLFISLILLYLTRPQGLLFLGVLLFMWFLTRLSLKRAIMSLLTFIVGAYFFDRKVLYPLSLRMNVYPIFTRGLQAFFQYSSSFAVSDALRGGVVRNVSLPGLASKTFYNLYNFYKLLPDIASPYIWGLFIIGIFKWGKDRVKNIFKLTGVLLVISNFLLVALTIPFYRYLHPIIPFVYVVGVATLVWIVKELVDKSWGQLKKYSPKFLGKKSLACLLSGFLVAFFVVGQTLGIIFLDSRFKAERINKGKPPVYVELSKILKDNTDPDELIVTNLDTWGSWYGERRTVWFPLKPSMLDYKEIGDVNFDAIYLTSYLIDDENYFMGEEWREIFNNPEDSSKWINAVSENYKFADEFTIESDENYEDQEARAILLVRR